MKFEFVDKREKYNAKIKVIGIGGGGGNAINNMINAKLKGVEFITANTDSQDLERSLCSNKLQLGINITKGLGSGADPEIGRLSGEESISEIKDAVGRSAFQPTTNFAVHGSDAFVRQCSQCRFANLIVNERDDTIGSAPNQALTAHQLDGCSGICR